MCLLIAVVAYTVCTNCVGTGSVEVVCDRCDGTGLVLNPRRHTDYRQPQRMPCPKCVKGLSRQDSKGTGKVRKSCPVCKGQKKVKCVKREPPRAVP